MSSTLRYHALQKLHQRPSSITRQSENIVPQRGTANRRWETDGATIQDKRRFIGRSFAGTDTVLGEPMLVWVCANYEGITAEEREEMTSFVIASEIGRAGMMMFAKTAAPSDTSSQLAVPPYSAMVLMRAYNAAEESRWFFKHAKSVADTFVFMTRGLVEGFPKLFIDKRWAKVGKGTKKVMENIIETVYPSNHLEIMKDKHHWFVNFVATDPSQQGRGQGSQLMRRISELADAAGVDCYLEANSENNMKFYEKFGFQTQGTSSCESPEEWKQNADQQPIICCEKQKIRS